VSGTEHFRFRFCPSKSVVSCRCVEIRVSEQSSVDDNKWYNKEVNYGVEGGGGWRIGGLNLLFVSVLEATEYCN
jgi:hypothetical protein